MDTHILIAGSHRNAPKGKKVAAAPADAPVTVQLHVRSKNEAARMAHYFGVKRGHRSTISRAEFERRYGMNRSDLQTISVELTKLGLTITGVHSGARAVQITGTVAQMQAAFQTQLDIYQQGKKKFRARTGSLSIPAALDGIVLSVHNFDQRPGGKRKTSGARPFDPAIHAGTAAGAAKPFTPAQVAALRNMPLSTRGKGQALALIELGGGFRMDDLQTYWTAQGVPVTPSVMAFSSDGATNSPTTADSADGEVMSDICVPSAFAWLAKYGVYFGTNTSGGFINVTSMAIHDKTLEPGAVSISWGMSKQNFAATDITTWTQLGQDAVIMGVVVLVASGDDGSTDGGTDGDAEIDWPSFCPDFICVGGVRTVGAVNTVWGIQKNKTGPVPSNGAGGGGVDDTQPVPDYQQDIPNLPVNANSGNTGRVGPDLGDLADPQTGWIVRVDGQNMVIGGTSLSTPFTAIGVLLLRAEGRKIANFHTVIYGAFKAGGVFYDVVLGSNGAYIAKKGFDACSGCGVADWTKLNAYAQANNL